MTLSINTNIGALTALSTLDRTNELLETTQDRVSSGLRVAQAKDDAASFTISSRLNSDVISLQAVQTGIGLGEAALGVAVSSASQISELL